MLAKEAHKKPTPIAELPVSRSLASLCKAAADPLRLDILRVLSQDSFGVQELASILSMPQPGMSHHLKILSQSGLLVTRRQGNSIFYRRALLKGDSELDVFQTSLYSTIDATALSDDYARKMATVHKERATQSKEYFAKNADKFEENQGMLCELPQYLSNLKELLDLTKLSKKSRVMEVGPGQGGLLQELATRFVHLVAIDSSSEILDLTKKTLGQENRNVEFVNCALESYSSAPNALDLVVLNMVMHHMPSPARAFQKLKELVKEGGFILIADLCSHNQEWAKEACGDVWLGFDPGDLNDWAKGAGFEAKQSLYLGLKNGFQIQLKLYRSV